MQIRGQAYCTEASAGESPVQTGAGADGTKTHRCSEMARRSASPNAVGRRLDRHHCRVRGSLRQFGQPSRSASAKLLPDPIDLVWAFPGIDDQAHVAVAIGTTSTPISDKRLVVAPPSFARAAADRLAASELIVCMVGPCRAFG